MGAFSSLLSGFVQGAGEHIADINERKRQEQVQNNRLANEASLDYLKNNPNLSPNDQERIFRNVLKGYGHKPADIDTLVGHAKGFGLMSGNGQGGGGAQASTPSPALGNPGEGPNEGSGEGPGVATPPPAQTPAPQQGLGPMPVAPNIGSTAYTPLHPNVYSDPANATRQERAEELENRKIWNQAHLNITTTEASNEAQTKRAITVDAAKRQAALDQIDKLNGTSKGYYLTEGPAGSSIKKDAGKYQPRPVAGTDLLGRKDTAGADIDPDKIYTQKDYPLAGLDSEYTPVGGAVKGAVIQDPNDPTKFITPYYSKAGTLIHSVPALPPRSQMGSQSSTTSTPTESGGTVTQRTTTPVLRNGLGAVPSRPTPGAPAPTVPASSGASLPPRGRAGGAASTTSDGSDAAADARRIYNKELSPSQLTAQLNPRARQVYMAHVKKELGKLDPNFNYEDAEATYKLATSPAFQNTVRYIDNTIESLPRLQASADKLANSRYKTFNDIKNAGLKQINGVDIGVFDTDRTLVGDEIGKILQGGGTGSGTSDKKLEQAQNIIRSSDDPVLVSAKLKEASELIGLRRKALTRGTPYEKGGVGGRGIPAPGSGTVTYTEGNDIYNIPADRVSAFEAKHPQAKKK